MSSLLSGILFLSSLASLLYFNGKSEYFPAVVVAIISFISLVILSYYKKDDNTKGEI